MACCQWDSNLTKLPSADTFRGMLDILVPFFENLGDEKGYGFSQQVRAIGHMYPVIQ
jgi:hypothetical protein